MIGFHYFPDTLHYRQHDLTIWLPRLQSLGARWLVLHAPTSRAIPEAFIKALLDAQIQPVLHFHLQPGALPASADLQLLFQIYRRWEVRYVTLFDRPNCLKSWRAANWVQADLVERFLDLYIPLANHLLHHGLTPIFPPLKPGGDYWDTAFLRRSLESIKRRGQRALLDHLVLGAYARPGNHPLQWGAGGPERWPDARPYLTPPGVEDQRGFRIFDWYLAISRAALGKARPIFLFGMGYRAGVDEHAKKNLLIAQLMNEEPLPEMESLPPQVIGGAFEPLVDLEGAPDSIEGWFRADGAYQPQAEALLQWKRQHTEGQHASPMPPRAIRHYLLLPAYAWGISDYHLDFIRPLIKKYQPTVGFSLEEARTAQRVTVVGGESDFPERSLNQLRAAGIFVERIQPTGTDIASLKSEQ